MLQDQFICFHYFGKAFDVLGSLDLGLGF